MTLKFLRRKMSVINVTDVTSAVPGLQNGGMTKIIPATLLLALALVGCSQGLSSKEKADYDEKISYAGRQSDIFEQALEKQNELQREALAIGYLDFEGEDYSGEMLKWVDYRSCLKEYKEIAEPLPKAKTACRLRANL